MGKRDENSFVCKFRRFMDASANVISDNHAYRPSSLFEDVRDMRLQTIADGKRNMRGDFMSFGKSFKIATKEAKKQHGKAATAK